MGKGITGHERPYEGTTNVWLTPKELINALGPFDLDPCAADPRPFDIGTTNYTEAEDGLSKLWSGLVWANPPYGPWVGLWLERIREHGNGIALVFARTDTKAMQAALQAADAVFFLAGRLMFLRGEPPFTAGDKSAGAPSRLLAYGATAVDRLEAFSKSRTGILYFKSSERAA
jgi:DNA N-6-adenine-methyltransferase (Dam)